MLASLLALITRAKPGTPLPALCAPDVKPVDVQLPPEVGEPIKPRHLRRAVRKRHAPADGFVERFASASDASRRFGRTLRTRNRAVRDLLADDEQLERYGLPLWRTEQDLADALRVSVRELRWFSQHRLADRFCHYVQFSVPKRRGGQRLILAPRRRLKALQRVVLRQLVDALPVSDCSHGYRKGRSIATGASAHVGKKIVLTMDIEEFFPTVTFARVRGYLIAMGYGYTVAATLAVLLTESAKQIVDVAGELYYVPVGERHCAQGVPTSPGLCNAIVLRMDRRLDGAAKHLGFAYTRYADDLVFSGQDPHRVSVLCSLVRKIVMDEGFRVNESKTRVARVGARQRVTGVTVNDVVGLSKRERRTLRAMIHQHRRCQDAGDEDRARRRVIEGKLAYLAMLNSAQAEVLRARLRP